MPASITATENTKTLPRGIRNNNPGNIRHSIAAWLGKAAKQDDESFVCFKTADYGIRAMARILVNYQKRYKLKTIDKMISRWAPPNENRTDAYIKYVSKAVGIDKNQEINLVDNKIIFLRLISAIIDRENGKPQWYGRNAWYDNSILIRGITMAINPEPSKNEDRSISHTQIIEHFRNA